MTLCETLGAAGAPGSALKLGAMPDEPPGELAKSVQIASLPAFAAADSVPAAAAAIGEPPDAVQLLTAAAAADQAINRLASPGPASPMA